MKTIYFPRNTQIESIIAFCDELLMIDHAEHVVIDFLRMGRVEPFTLLFCSNALREFVSKYPVEKYSFKNYHSKTYPANMGFFKSFGLEYGKEPGEAYGSGTYLPISELPINQVVDEATKEWTQEQNVLEDISEHLSKILSRSNLELQETLQYSIREIIRNSFEHSETDTIYYSAQYWPYYKKVEIAVLDVGGGISKSLSKNPHVRIDSDKDAIQFSMMPGISGKNYEGARVDKDDKWHNSGFGLYMTSRLCRNGGEFIICSGKDGVQQHHGNGKKHLSFGYSFNGTAVKMVLMVEHLASLNSMLTEFRTEGYAIAAKIKGLGEITAPNASKMITDDFKLD